VRKANYVGARGFERERRDSIWLLDAQGNNLGDSAFRPSLAGRVVHNRHVVKAMNGHQVDVHFNTVMDWRVGGSERVGVWNGTITGTFRGVEFKKTEIKDVVRPMILPGRFGFPISGSIHAERWIFTIDLVFEGGGNATATITNTRNGNVHIVKIKRS
jgi:hypothetical protein